MEVLNLGELLMQNCQKKTLLLTDDQVLRLRDLINPEVTWFEESELETPAELLDLQAQLVELEKNPGAGHTGHMVVNEDGLGSVNVCCQCFDECEFEPEQEVGRLIDGNGDTVPCYICGTDIG